MVGPNCFVAGMQVLLAADEMEGGADGWDKDSLLAATSVLLVTLACTWWLKQGRRKRQYASPRAGAAVCAQSERDRHPRLRWA
jgi:hypothetical protein